jgi:hypothetical protein
VHKMFWPLLASIPLAACSTVHTVKLDSDRAFLTADIAFKSAQQTTLALCSVPNSPKEICVQAIGILHNGAQYEAAGFSAQQTGSASDEAAAVTNLTNLISQLTTLGLLKAN